MTMRVYRVRVLDGHGFIHVHDLEAGSADARRLAVADTRAAVGEVAYTIDVHTERGALCFRHPFAD